MERERSSPSGRRDRERRSFEPSRGTLLVIDDDEEIRTALAQILELSGYDVMMAADGQEGVELLAVGIAPHAIVLDLMMPRMDGWTFLALLRADARFRDVPVLVTSAAPGEPPPGADACLPKPFDVSQLHREVARLCAH